MPDTIPPCPMCGNNRHAIQHGRDEFFCSKHGLYDGNPDEGGSYMNDPSKRMERVERQNERSQQRRYR